MKVTVLLIAIVMTFNSQAQDTSLPFAEIPDNPADFGPGNIVSRMIDGLGFRYYWASDSLQEEDLNYKPSEDGRSTYETIQHVYGLSGTIMNAALNQPNTNSDWSKMGYEDFRRGTLDNLKKASEAMLGKSEQDIAALKITFQNGKSFPFWNLINGPIADAIYHTGQIVAFRRSSGNPINGNLNMFTGEYKK